VVQRDPRAEGTLKQPLVLLIGAPLPPPYGGVARYIQLLLPTLARRGFRIHVVHPGRGPAPPLPNLPDGSELTAVVVEYPGAIRLIAWLLRRPRALATILRWYARALVRAPGYAIRELAMTASLIRSGERLLDGERPAIVHGFDTPWSYGVATLLLAQETGAKSMFSFFGDVLPHAAELEHFEAAGRSFAPASRAVLEGVDLAASMTNHCRELVRSLGLPPEDVALVRVIGDMDPFDPQVDGQPVRGRHGDGPILLFVGHVRARKGPQVLVEALPAVRARFPDARAVFVGPDYGHAAEVLSLAKRLGVEDAIDVVGTVGDDELPSYYAAADVFVFPTMTTIECLGLSFVQAMFAGVPVVATRIAGAPEVIRDGRDGRLVEPGDAQALAQAINELLDLPQEERRALGLRGRERASELFEKQAVLDDLLRSYDGLLSPRG
jgi:phosphatidylinositol alpha-1,6-mannosyltransferase